MDESTANLLTILLIYGWLYLAMKLLGITLQLTFYIQGALLERNA
jgi:hypothetical protein